MGLVWRERGAVYLVGVAMLVVATLAYSVGHVAPFWVTQDGDQTQNRPVLNIGLWFRCSGDGVCSSQPFGFDEDIVKATRILQVLGLLMLVTSVAVAIFANCRRKHPGTSFFLEIVIVMGGLLGFSGSMVYLAGTREDVDTSSLSRYHWAFALSIAASLLALLSAAFIFIANFRSFRHHRGGSGSKRGGSVGDEGVAGDQYPRNAGTGDDAYPVGFEEPEKDYPPDPAVFHKERSAWRQPATSQRFSAEQGRGRQGDPRAVGYPGKGWRKVQMKTPPRRFHEQRVYVGSGMEPGGRYPVSMVPAGAFMIPRVVVRGYYEPGYGYPEYTLL
ncbi:uncharacterized protein LOC143292014 [Babylonia areolata]|uniref:uncharacterized protein LOC143292014 n=1 Tax=Babylonia areolata TaxID=304850 RepID=UPI003FD60453